MRWSAAKSIGRITEHLPFELGDQVVESIFHLIETTQDENSTHGASMALAELTRRGKEVKNNSSSKKQTLYRTEAGQFTSSY